MTVTLDDLSEETKKELIEMAIKAIEEKKSTKANQSDINKKRKDYVDSVLVELDNYIDISGPHDRYTIRNKFTGMLHSLLSYKYKQKNNSVNFIVNNEEALNEYCQMGNIIKDAMIACIER